MKRFFISILRLALPWSSSAEIGLSRFDSRESWAGLLQYPAVSLIIAFLFCLQLCGQTAASGRAGGTGTQLFVTNPQTSTYQAIQTDFQFFKTIPVASGTFTITLVASAAQPPSGQGLRILNYGSGVVTVAPSGQNINGSGSSITLVAGSASAPTGVFIVSDGTNYFAQPSTATGSVTAGVYAVGNASTGLAAGHIDDGVTTAGTNTTTEPLSLGTGQQLVVVLTAGSTGTTANSIVAINSSGQVITAIAGQSGQDYGIALDTATSGNPVRVAIEGIVLCTADNGVTAQHLMIPGSTTGGRCKDSSVGSANSVFLSEQIVGVALTSASAGSTFSMLIGSPMFGSNAGNTPNGVLDIAAGLVTHYNNIATVGNGVPSEYAVINLTGQTAAIAGGTALYTPANSGRFRITYTSKVTTAASVSSILGGTTGLALAYTDATDSVAQAVTCSEFSQAGNNLAIGTGNVGNSTTTVLYGECYIFAKTGVAITYGFGYTSSGTAMAYDLRITVAAE
jgi:hypothetical protein